MADLLFQHDHILSAMFQPAAYAGNAAELGRPREAVTIPDVISALAGAGSGTVSPEDFSPLPCSHPACFSLAFYLKIEHNRYVPIKQMVNAERYMDLIQNRAIFGTDSESFQLITDAVYDLWSGPAALSPDSRKTLDAVRTTDRLDHCGRRLFASPGVKGVRALGEIDLHPPVHGPGHLRPVTRAEMLPGVSTARRENDPRMRSQLPEEGTPAMTLPRKTAALCFWGIILIVGVLPLILYWPSFMEQPAPDSLAIREISKFAQWLVVITAFGVKPAYMLLALVWIVWLWRRQATDLVALRWGLIFFLGGEIGVRGQLSRLRRNLRSHRLSGTAMAWRSDFRSLPTPFWRGWTSAWSSTVRRKTDAPR